jgi:hypothetical protein
MAKELQKSSAKEVKCCKRVGSAALRTYIIREKKLDFFLQWLTPNSILETMHLSECGQKGQGDQTGRFFAYWMIVYFVLFN